MNIKRSAWLVAAFAMLASCAYGAWAPEEIVVAGRNETVTLNVPDQDVESVPGNVFIGSGGALHKTGGGLLTMPLEKFVQGTEVTVGVREGAVRIAVFDPENFNFSEPYDTLEKAALWLDASADGKVLYTSSNGVDWVDGWLDVRETGNETDGYEYLRALTNLDPANIAPTLVETNGVKAVWFGGYKSGRSLNWCDAAGAITTVSNIRHAFILYGVYESHGFVLGLANGIRTAAGTPTFHIGDAGSGSPTDSIGTKIYSDTAAVYTGRTFVNGEMVDASKNGQLKQRQFQLLEYDCCGKPGRASNFFNDRNYFSKNSSYPSAGGNRIGGDYIAEALIFTNELTEAERISVEAYLMNKHLGVRAPKVKVVLAEDATALVEANALRDSFITGDGTLMVADNAADLLAMPNFDFAGLFDIGGGTYSLGNLFALQVFDGDRITVSQDGYRLPTASLTSDAGAGQVVKEGSGPALFTRIPETVGTVSVNGGTLRLAAPPRKQNPIVPGSVTEVVFQNPDFEEVGPTTNAEYKTAQTVAHWNLVGVKDGTHCAIFIGGDGTGSGWGTTGTPYQSPLPTPDGGMALMLKGDASAWTSIDIPTDDIYDISFLSAPRNGYGNRMFDICIGPSADNLVTVGSFTVSDFVWRPFRMRTPLLKAGANQQFWFRNWAEGTDKAVAVDCIRMTLVTDLAPGTIPVPNGSFELRGASFADSTLRTNNLAAGWTLTQTNGWTSGTPSAAFTTPNMDSLLLYRFDYGHNHSGNVQLMLGYTGSKAETTFTPATGGVYRLKGLVANYRSGQKRQNTTYVNAKLTSGGTVKDLGTLAVSVYRLTEMEWPNAVNVAAGEEVTLTLESRDATVMDAFTLIDDLELTPAVEKADELLAAGGFETAVWHLTQLYTKPSGVGASSRFAYPTSTSAPAYINAYGTERYEGNYMYYLVQNDIIWQQIEFPSAGLYRLSYFGHTRKDNITGKGLNPVKAFWVAEGSTVTNWIGTATPKSTNFVECVFTFKVPSATRATFGLQGGTEPTNGNQGDHTTVLDGVSLKQVFSENGGLPDVPEGLTVRVAADAKLSLDYDGTLELRALYLGGHAARGLITSATHPQYVSGVGEIYVKPRGAVFTIR